MTSASLMAHSLASSMRLMLALPHEGPALDLDDPRTTELRRELIVQKPFLRRLYQEWYEDFQERVETAPAGKLVELGSGAGFLKEIMPEVITSDILPLSTCEQTFSAEEMPFADGDLSGIFMIDVLHHICEPALFFQEAQRTLKTGGKIVMVEPALTAWARWIYSHFHHEPIEPSAGWHIPASGPLSGANTALPWIIFERDRAKFEKDFPKLRIQSIQHHTPLRYLLSGGVSYRTLVPGFAFGFFRILEKVLRPFSGTFSMFQTIELVKVD